MMLGFDKKNGNTKWRDAEKMELVQLDDYNTFNKLGKSVKPPDGYQRICVHFVYAVKHDLCQSSSSHRRPLDRTS